MNESQVKDRKKGGLSPLVFLFPYREVSGVPVVFLKMAEFISETYGIELRIVDYPDGYMARTLKKTSAIKIVQFEEGVPLNIEPDSVLVMQSILPYSIHPELRIGEDTKIILWTLHQLNLVQTLVPLPWFQHKQTTYPQINRMAIRSVLFPLGQKLRSLLTSLADKKSIVFGDFPTLRHTCESLGVHIDKPILLPVPCDEHRINRKLSLREKVQPVESVSFGWMGRIVDSKAHVLIYTIHKLSDYAAAKRIPIELHIIGTGPYLEKIKNIKNLSPFLRLLYIGEIIGQTRDEYLLNNVDVLLAMGASALDGGALGIPTILLDMSYGPIPLAKDYRFRWLFSSEGYRLADIISASNFEKGNNSLEQIMNSVFTDYWSISESTYSYCLHQHGISVVAANFLDIVEKATFRYSDFSPDILRKGLIRKTYEFVRRLMT